MNWQTRYRGRAQPERRFLPLLSSTVQDGVSVTHPLVEFEPRGKTFTVLVLQTKEPGLPQPDRLHYLNTTTTTNTINICQSGYLFVNSPMSLPSSVPFTGSR